MLEDNRIIQNILDIIDGRITEKLSARELARECGYSTFHLNRVFSRATNMTLMAYVTRRKLQYALFDLSCGEKIIDVAVKYGFETHAGFTKAFKKCYRYPPSIYRIHAICSRPARMDLLELRNVTSGGEIMNPEIIEMKPFTVVGFTHRYKIQNVRFTHDIPVYWDTINMDYDKPIKRLHNAFSKSRHCEYTVCFDVDPVSGEFTYLLGVGVDNPEDHARIEPDMYEMTMPGGVYSKFTTPLVESGKYPKTVRDTWKEIFENWLPASAYEFDEKRYDFEYYDKRDHAWENNGMAQMDIYIPVKNKTVNNPASGLVSRPGR